MRFRLGRDTITVIPEGHVDDAYIEDTLGLRENGAFIRLVRRNVVGSSNVNCLETETFKQRRQHRDWAKDPA